MIGKVLRMPEPTPANFARLKLLEAQAAAAEHIEALAETLETGARFCAEVADGGDSYPAAIRDFARRRGAQLGADAAGLRGLMARAR